MAVTSIAAAPWPWLLASLVEGSRHDLRREGRPADQDLESRSDRVVPGGQVSHPDALSQEGSEAAAGDAPCRATREDDRIAVPGNPLVDHLEADQAPLDPALSLACQLIAADEVSLFPAHDPAEVRLQNGGGLVDVVSVERHLRLEPQGVPCTQPRRRQPFRPARLHQPAPDLRRAGRRNVDLEAVLPR